MSRLHNYYTRIIYYNLQFQYLDKIQRRKMIIFLDLVIIAPKTISSMLKIVFQFLV